MKTLLSILVTIIAVTSSMAGLMMMTDPTGNTLGLSTTLLKDTPFHDYLAPGILLIAIVSIANLLAVFHNIESDKRRYNWSIAGSLLAIAWTIMQMIWIQTPHWLNIIIICTGVMIILLAYHLKGKWAV